MLARLWWKEMREFWPLWFALPLMAALAQWAALNYGNVEMARAGALSLGAVAWGALYALLVGSASFAGEREHRTLRFLDTLPVPRSMLWLGKASFGLITSAGLTALLLGLAEWATVERDVRTYPLALIALSGGALIAECLAWGLFWSALLGNTIGTAVLTLFCVSILNFALPGSPIPALLDSISPLTRNPAETVEAAVVRFVGAALALLISAAVLERGQRPRGPRVPKPAVKVRVVVDAPTGEVYEAPAGAFSAVRRIIWQTWRQTSLAWVPILGAAAGLGVVALLTPSGLSMIVIVGPWLAALILGVLTFGSETRTRCQWFYAARGVRPLTIWGAKIIATLLSLVTLGVAWGIVVSTQIPNPFGGPPLFWLLTAAYLFAFGQLNGMLFSRTILALFFTIAATVLVMWAHIPANSDLLLIPPWLDGLALGFLFVTSCAWSGDWMNDGSGPGRWVRLTVLLVSGLSLVSAGFIGDRALSVPDIAPPVDAISVRARMAEADAVALSAYGPALDALRERGSEGAPGDPEALIGLERGALPQEVVEWIGHNRAAVEAALRVPVDQPLSVTPGMSLRRLDRRADFLRLGHLLGCYSRQLLNDNDLDGAWAGIRSLRELGWRLRDWGSWPTVEAGIDLEFLADTLAMDWAQHPKQDRTRLAKAAEEVRAWRPEPGLDQTVQVWYAELDRDFLRRNISFLDYLQGENIASTREGIPLGVEFFLFDAPWERVRVERLAKLVAADQLVLAQRMPYQWPSPGDVAEFTDLTWPLQGESKFVISGRSLFDALMRTPLARGALDWSLPLRWELPNRELAQRRALNLILTGLSQDSTKPPKREDWARLISEQPLPWGNDPFTGGPFHVIEAEGQLVCPSRLPSPGVNAARTELRQIWPGEVVLMSVGPDRVSQGGQATFHDARNPAGDLIFPVRRRPMKPPPDFPAGGGGTAGPSGAAGMGMGMPASGPE